MKTIKYFILGISMAILTLGGFINLIAQKSTIEFLETYTGEEITSRLEKGDMLFQLMDINQNDQGSSLVGYCIPDRTEGLWEYIHSEPFLQKLPGDVMFSWGSTQGERGIPLYALKNPGKNHAGPDGSDIEQVEVVSDNQSGPYSLLISFSSAGAEKWAELTGSNIGRDIAIVINDRVWSAPRVQDQIKMGKCMISGNFSKREASALREQLDPNP